MANGQQKAEMNVKAFKEWVATQTDDDFRQITRRGQLNRQEIATGAGFAKSALNQNPIIKDALKELEDNLRKRNVLPPLTEKAKKDEGAPKQYDKTSNRKLMESRRLSSLEAENVELKAKVKELENKLANFGELSETIAEIGLMPR